MLARSTSAARRQHRNPGGVDAHTSTDAAARASASSASHSFGERCRSRTAAISEHSLAGLTGIAARSTRCAALWMSGLKSSRWTSTPRTR